MKTIPINNIYSMNYHVDVVNSTQYYFSDTKEFSFFDAPKEYNLLLYINGCKAIYTTKDGQVIPVSSGNIVYTPTNCEYSIKLYDFSSENRNTVGVNFFLLDNNHNHFVLSNNITVFDGSDPRYMRMFSQLPDLFNAAHCNYSKVKSVFFDIIAQLSSFNRTEHILSRQFHTISKGILYLEQDNARDLSIKEIADMCNVSESYFRKLFKKYSGMSPIDYKINIKIARAKQYLKYDNLSVAEISNMLSFMDTAYFIKQFKRRTGMTPTQYKKTCL